MIQRLNQLIISCGILQIVNFIANDLPIVRTIFASILFLILGIAFCAKSIVEAIENNNKNKKD